MFSTSACENPYILKIILFGSKFIEIFYYLIPVILIIMLSLDFSKNVIFADDQSLVQKNIQLAIKRIISIVILFIIPTIVSVTLNLVENSNTMASDIVSSYNKCQTNTKKINYYEKKFKAKVEQEEKEIREKQAKLLEKKNKEQADFDNYANKLKYKTKNKLLEEMDKFDNLANNSNVGTGQAYNDITQEELIKIANLCQQEQGSAVGAAAEAELMANKYELASNKGDFKNLYDYVRNNNEANPGSWWLDAGTYMDNPEEPLRPNVLVAVKDVLINGKRTMPPYINEHDGFNDIKSISTGSVRNRSDYHPNETIVYNNMESHYTFYSFPTESSDPFGYTDDAYNKLNGNG